MALRCDRHDVTTSLTCGFCYGCEATAAGEMARASACAADKHRREAAAAARAEATHELALALERVREAEAMCVDYNDAARVLWAHLDVLRKLEKGSQHELRVQTRDEDTDTVTDGSIRAERGG